MPNDGTDARAATGKPGEGESIFELLGPQILSAGDDEARLRFTVEPRFTIGRGVVQGGVVTAMLDMAMALAAGGAISTASIHVEILRPAVGPTLLVEGRVVRKGRRIVFAEASMRDPESVLVARGTQTAVPLG